MSRLLPTLIALVAAAPATAQVTTGPFRADIPTANPTVVGVSGFARIPDVGGEAPRMMLLLDEPGTRRLFVNAMTGALWSVSYDGRSVTEYLDTDDDRWGMPVQSQGRERGFQSFAIHPDFAREGAPGYGKLYTWSDTENMGPTPDFRPGGGDNTHHTVLLEWTARNAEAATYDGGAPRVLMRFEQPFRNHNAGHLAFNPLARPGEADHGMLYVGVADGGSGGDPLDLAQSPRSLFGKIVRIDPLGSNGRNGEYGIPADNPFADGAAAEPEIWVSGLRNPQRFGWDPLNGNLFVADIGQNIVEEVSLAPKGADLGWNTWEGSFRFVNREGVDTSDPRGDRTLVYPVVEWGHDDPLMIGRAAVTGIHVVRAGPLRALYGRVLFGDFPSGEIFHFDADHLPDGGNQAIGRVLLDDGSGEPKTLLQLIREQDAGAARADLRFGAGPDGRVFILNKHDGTIRELVPQR